ncbi:MAG: TonB-dependent receptor, partial [Alphaproteobacteria bacterium]|nr:TonB-dependent receptor [Alphaproteobacteria bacterium]
TRKPTDEFEGYVEGQYGNYDHLKFNGAVNIPLSDRVAMRVAGFFFDRDGFIENQGSGNDIDDREIYSLRGTLGVDLTERTRIDLMVQYFEEDDHRSRIGKQLCDRDDRPFPFSIGCTNNPPGFETLNSTGTLGTQLESAFLDSFYAAAPSGIPDGMGGQLSLKDIGFIPLVPVGLDPLAGTENPADLRVHDTMLDPDYEADELLITLELNHEFDNFTFTYIGAYQDTSVFSMQDYNMVQPSVAWDPVAVAQIQALTQMDPFIGAAFDGVTFSGNEMCFPGFGCADRTTAFDRSFAETEMTSHEVHVTSNFDGPLNFILGTSYMYWKNASVYEVHFSGAEVFGRLPTATDPQGNPTIPYLVDPTSVFFNNVSDPTKIESWAVFGELYYDLSEDTRVTVGLRYTNDKKTLVGNEKLLNPFSPEVVQKDTWDDVTGRVTIDHTIDHGDGDSTLLYGSVSRGYKAGGFNSPVQEVFMVSERFDQENIWAYEIGAKNTFFNNRFQANLSGFFYDYQDYQISRIVARTSVNDNVDARIWGLEAEFLATPVDGLLLTLNVAFLDTSIRDESIVDPADPSGGVPGIGNAKDIYVAVVDGMIPGGIPGLDPSFSPLAANVIFDEATGFPIIDPETGFPSDGIPVNLKGNELQNSPRVSIKIGAQYTWSLGNSGELTFRVDHFWQDSMFGRIFNSERDKIDSWNQTDAQLTWQAADAGFSVEAWIKNIFNNDDVTGQYFTDASSGNFTNVFILDPRTYGVTVRANF